MLTRLWFALSLLWALLIVTGTSPSRWTEYSTGTLEEILLLAFLPLIVGLVLKRLAKYVVLGE